MIHSVKVLWFLCQFVAAYSWGKEGFPNALCISWQTSLQCRGGITALSSNGVWLNTSVYFVDDGSSWKSRSVSQWIEFSPGQTAAVEYDEDMQSVSVFPSGNQTSENISQPIPPTYPSQNAAMEKYSIVQPEHGGGQCNCLQVYFSSDCTQPEDNDTKRLRI